VSSTIITSPLFVASCRVLFGRVFVLDSRFVTVSTSTQSSLSSSFCELITIVSILSRSLERSVVRVGRERGGCQEEAAQQVDLLETSLPRMHRIKARVYRVSHHHIACPLWSARNKIILQNSLALGSFEETHSVLTYALRVMVDMMTGSFSIKSK